MFEADCLDGGDEPLPVERAGYLLRRREVAAHPIEEVPFDQMDGHVPFP